MFKFKVNRDVFWASFEYFVGKEDFEKSFSKQIAKFCSPGRAESIVRYLFTILIVLLISVANKPHLSFQLLFRYK